MVERIDDPHSPVQVHGFGRLADGRDVPVPPRRLPLATGQFVAGCVCAVIVVALMAAGIAGLLP